MVLGLAGWVRNSPITQGTLLRLVMRQGERGVEQALALLSVVTAHARHHFWPDVLLYEQARWHGVVGHRQVTTPTSSAWPGTLGASS